MIFRNLQKVWHYLKCVIILNQEIGIHIKKKFDNFGDNSLLMKPFLQLTGCENINIGCNTTILSNARLSVYGNSDEDIIIIGNNCYISFGFSVLASSKAKITIGNEVLIASNVLITNENHGIDIESNVPYMYQDLVASDVVIGNGCWIGENVCILPGVFIGEKCIVGAGAVVTKSIPSYSIAVGNPARVIKTYNFDVGGWVKNDENG